MTVFFTSDQHWGHAAILNMAARPFDTVEQMDASMLEAWNSVVRPPDTVWFLGDLAHGLEQHKLDRLFRRLHGTKRLIQGNHDNAATLALPWASVSQLELLRLEGERLTLCHYALREWPAFYRGGLHFFGHSHSKMPGSRRSIDVGVDSVGFVPQTVDQLKARMALLPELSFKNGVELSHENSEDDIDEWSGPRC